jgi:hypothetical protein
VLQPGASWTCSFPFTLLLSAELQLPPALPFDANITFASPGSGLPLRCTRAISLRFLDLCDVQWSAPLHAPAPRARDAVSVVAASAAALRLHMRVPAVLGLVGSACTVRCCGGSVCELRVTGACEEGGGGDRVRVELCWGADMAQMWIVSAVAAACN